jgi:DNA-binding CsgD family transcriptional regulator
MSMSALEVPEASRTISSHVFAGVRFVVVASATPARPRWVATLTGAEAAVLARVAEGMRTRDIAVARGCGVPTIVKQIAALKRKTGSQDLAELTSLGRWYASQGTSEPSRPTALEGRAVLRAASVDRGARRPLALRDARRIWAELLDGRWSFVEQRDLGGERWLVLRESAAGEGGLSAREREVVAFLLDGAPNKVIGLELGLSPSTVSVCVGRVLRRLGIADRSRLVEVGAILGGAGAG